MNQLPLFSLSTASSPASYDQRLAVDDSAALLAMFESARTAEGAHPRSVKRKLSQLRALVREARIVVTTATLRTLFGDLGLLAQVLREPTTLIARSTGRARLLAAQRFIQAVAPSLGRDPAADLAVLDSHLPTQRSKGWHTTGTLVAGVTARRRRRGPALDAADLRRLVEAAGSTGGLFAHRDRALVALHCFSGLRPEEIVRLRWEDLDIELTVNGQYGLTAAVDRGSRHLRLFLPGPASGEIEALAATLGEPCHVLSGPILCARREQAHPLSYRAERDVLESACRRINGRQSNTAALRAARAHWLRAQGLSDHEVAAVLGLARVRSVDRLLQGHLALDAQRIVRESRAR